MGCMSSKGVMSRSWSYEEGLRRSLQKNGSRSRQLLALLAGANQLQKAAFAMESSSHSAFESNVDSVEIINASELMAGLEEPLVATDRELGEKGVTGSRSLRTVEEYDALLNTILQPTVVQEVVHLDDDDVECCSSASQDQSFKSSIESVCSYQICVPKAPKLFISHEEWRVDFAGGGGGEANYLTPKFGRYNPNPLSLKDSSTPWDRVSRKSERKCSTEEESVVVEPALVAAFEQRMKVLEVEQEDIVRSIDRNVVQDKDDTKDLDIGEVTVLFGANIKRQATDTRGFIS